MLNAVSPEASLRTRLSEMVELVTAYPLCRVVEPARFAPGLGAEAFRGANLSPALRRFYEATDGFSFFWDVPQSVPGELIDAYNEVPAPDGRPQQRIDWDSTHGIMIPPLAELLARSSGWTELRVSERPEPVVQEMTGGRIGAEQIAGAVLAFDRYLAHGTEDGCVGLLMLPGEEERVVGISDSGLIDPRRPWMTVGDYLDLIIATAGEIGSRSALCGMEDAAPGRLGFTPEQLASFREDLFRPLPG